MVTAMGFLIKELFLAEVCAWICGENCVCMRGRLCGRG
jgi:hypothetical protein